MKKKLTLIALGPMLLMAIAVMVLTTTIIKDDLEKDVERTLRGVAYSYLETIEQHQGAYELRDDGTVWKGQFNISDSEEIVDFIKEKGDVEVTFFYGKTRKMTSVQNEKGERVLETDADETVCEQVLQNGEVVFLENVPVVGMPFFGFYLPVYQDDSDEIIGMVFAGLDHESGLAAYNGILKVLLIVTILVLVIGTVIGILSAVSIAKDLESASGAVKAIAAGQLTVELDNRCIHRNDEIGDLCKALENMKNELRFIIEDVNKNAEALLSSAVALDENAQSTLETVDSVDRAVNDIAEGATSQAKDAIRAAENVAIMGDMLEATNRDIADLNDNARVMRKSSELATDSLEELMKVNQEVMDAIELIYEQTNRTNESSMKIREATNIISSISDETNLLSLNASIEAARAGEQGRGFAVVANEIQHLADQSGASTDAIAEMVNDLIEDSNMAVRTMERVREIVLSQSKNVAETQADVAEVIQAIEQSISSISSIEQQSIELDRAKDEIVMVVESLSAVSEENAASTEETSAATTEVADSFNEVTQSAESLKAIADSIAGTMSNFQL